MRASPILLIPMLASCTRPASLGESHVVRWADGAAPCDPQLSEICNGRDDDCDGAVDEDGAGGSACFDPCRVVQIAQDAALRADGVAFIWNFERATRSGQSVKATRLQIPERVVQVTPDCARTESGRAYCRARIAPRLTEEVRELPGAGNTVSEIYQSSEDHGLLCVRRSGPQAGTLWCWDYAGLDHEEPHQVEELGNQVVRAVSGGFGLGVCALLRGGDIWCSASYHFGSPVRRMDSLGDDNVEVVAGVWVCARKRSGQVSCSEHPQGVPRSLDFGMPARTLAMRIATVWALGSGGFVAGIHRDTAPTNAALEVVGLPVGVEAIAPFCALANGNAWCWGPAGPANDPPPIVPVAIDVCPERAL